MVTLQNPFNPKDFEEDKLSILDIKAVDMRDGSKQIWRTNVA
jgi:hypothetical protein